MAAPLTSILKTTSNGTPFKAAENSDFQTPEIKLAISRLRQAFTKTPILHHFDPERYIQIETNVSGYVIDGIFSQLTLEFRQWHLIAFFSKIIIPIKTRYETHNQELLTIFEVFKTWHYSLEGYKFEVIVLTNHNNLC